LLVERDGKADSAFNFAQFDKAMFAVIQLHSVVLGNGVCFIEAIFDIKELRDGKRRRNQVSVVFIDLVGKG